MHSQFLVLFSLFCAGWSRDIELGNMEGRKIFDEVRQANPAIWRQYENVTVIAPENELISKVVITDMRPEKDGDVQIVDGGDGKKSVTIELKSPTVLRGYEFHIEVYAVPDTVATDAEEHLYNDGMAPMQNNESTELPENVGEDVNDDDELIQSNETTELLDKATNEDVKDGPTAVAGDINTDSIRPPRETEEGTSFTDVPEDYTTTISYETSSNSESDELVNLNQDKTTELPETPEDPTVAEVSPDNIRPARETVLDTVVITSASPVIDSTESAFTEETTETASETMTDTTESEVKDTTTTEPVVTTPSYEYSTFTPIAYDNSKNIPDYPSLNILDYIKNREALRPIRHTETEGTEEKDESYQPSVQLDENTSYTTPQGEETSSTQSNDDNGDLLPPKIDASYNTDFAGSETTEHPVEGFTLNNVPRAGRGINFDDNISEEITPTPTNTDEESTPTPTNTDATTPTLDEDHTVASLDDQLRNTRGANDDENDVNVSEENPQGTNLSNEGIIPSEDVDVKQPNRNVIVVNLDKLMTRDENNKFVYALPIVLVINSENNYPIIKIIAEDASNERDNMGSKVLYPTQPSDDSLEPNEYDYKSMESGRIKKGDYMPSGDYDNSQ